jgi:hypothetical protein
MNPNEIWQVDVNGQVYEATFQELTQWIGEGSLLRSDKVRRKNLRWLDAGKIPSLYGFFDAKDCGLPMPQVKVSATEVLTVEPGDSFSPAQAGNFAATQYFPTNQTDYSPVNNFSVNECLSPTQNFQQQQNRAYGEPQFYQPQFDAQVPDTNVCIIHADAEPYYFCETCSNIFCKACPKGYGGSVKICPLCGAMCVSIKQAQQVEVQNLQLENDLREGFGFQDFGRALVYPFKFKASLFFGAVLFMLFTLGQSASALGNMFLVAAALFCFMLANMLTFGILANTVEDFSQGKIGGNFMPSFDDFSLWDDVVHPFFLSIGVYIASFGLMFALIIGGVWYMWNSLSSSLDPSMPIANKDLQTGKNPPKIPNKGLEMWEEKITPSANANQNFQQQNNPLNQNGFVNDEEEEFQRLQDMINQSRKKEMESVIGKDPQEEREQYKELAGNFLKSAGVFFVLILLAFLWGIFYFPAACAVAGYTRSFTATLNPMVGLDTIKRLGVDYLKILAMCLVLVIFSAIVNLILSIVFAPLDLPRMGNLAVAAVGSWFTFYLSVVFSLILGYALYKNSAKMNLFRG